MTKKISKTDKEWQEILNPEQYEITRHHGTEAAHTGIYEKHKEKGTYVCVCCGTELFASIHKYDSGSGWPSFYQPFNKEVLEEKVDLSHGMQRKEVICSSCDAHLGHVFPDGPQPTGVRYCINSAALEFNPYSQE